MPVNFQNTLDKLLEEAWEEELSLTDEILKRSIDEKTMKYNTIFRNVEKTKNELITELLSTERKGIPNVAYCLVVHDLLCERFDDYINPTGSKFADEILNYFYALCPELAVGKYLFHEWLDTDLTLSESIDPFVDAFINREVY